MKRGNFKNLLPYGNCEKVLLHICCAPDATYPILYLRGRHYNVTGFFYNPNIHPKEEYEKRLGEAINLSKKLNFPLIEGEYNPDVLRKWFTLIRGLEHEKEGGSRCYICYKERLERTAELAKEMGFDYFTTTISISPHKRSEWVFGIGEEIENKLKIKFLKTDFKKRNGFKSSVILSHFFGLYRQSYCGCIFSKVESSNLNKDRF